METAQYMANCWPGSASCVIWFTVIDHLAERIKCLHFYCTIKCPCLKYIESRMRSFMESNHIALGTLSFILEWAMQHWPLYMHSFFPSFWQVQLFLDFVHNRLVMIDSNLQLCERNLYNYLLLTGIGSSPLAFEPWNWILNLLIKYWPLKCKINASWNVCFPSVNFYFITIILEMSNYYLHWLMDLNKQNGYYIRISQHLHHIK